MIFIYLDESGNYTFSEKGSKYLIYTALTTRNPYLIHYNLCELERKLMQKQTNLDPGYFHATENKQRIRNEGFKVLGESEGYEIDSVVVEKTKINPVLRDEIKLYKKIYGILLNHVISRYSDLSKISIFMDNVPNRKKRGAMEKGIKETLSEIVEHKKIKYHLLHSSSALSYGLQAVDYCCWALKKKCGDWNQIADERPYSEICHRVKSNYNMCVYGDSKKYY